MSGNGKDARCGNGKDDKNDKWEWERALYRNKEIADHEFNKALHEGGGGLDHMSHMDPPFLPRKWWSSSVCWLRAYVEDSSHVLLARQF